MASQKGLPDARRVLTSTAADVIRAVLIRPRSVPAKTVFGERDETNPRMGDPARRDGQKRKTMLDPWIIEEIRRREEEQKRAPQPELEIEIDNPTGDELGERRHRMPQSPGDGRHVIIIGPDGEEKQPPPGIGEVRIGGYTARGRN